MDHRLPLVLLAGILAHGCAADGDQGTGTGEDDPSTRSSSTDPEPAEPHVEAPGELLTTSASPQSTYTFELVIDGQSSTLATGDLGIIEATGADCATSWSLSASHGPQHAGTLSVRLAAESPLGVGTRGPLGGFDESAGQSILNAYDVGGNLVVEMHSPAYTIAALDIDTVEIAFEAGTVCSTPSSFDEDGSNCPPFSTASLRLVESHIGFDPDAMYCRDAITSGGDTCFAGAIGADRGVELCP